MGENIRLIIKKVKRDIENDIRNHCNVGELAHKYDIPIRKLEDHFRYMFGCSPKEYIIMIRMKILPTLIKKYKKNFSGHSFSIAKDLGFSDTTSLYKLVDRETGLSYKEYRDNLGI